MAEKNQERHFAGIPAGTTAQPDIAGTFRTYVNGAETKIIDTKWGEQLSIPVRISLGAQGTRGARIFCSHDFSQRGKYVRLLKAINGISGDLPADFDLSTLNDCGDILAEVETNEEGYLNVTGFMALPRYENGAVATPDVVTTTTDANGRRLIKLDNGRMVDAETGELADQDAYEEVKRAMQPPPPTARFRSSRAANTGRADSAPGVHRNGSPYHANQ